MCDRVENDFTIDTVGEIHEATEKLGDDVYSSNMTKMKLKPMNFW